MPIDMLTLDESQWDIPDEQPELEVTESETSGADETDEQQAPQAAASPAPQATLDPDVIAERILEKQKAMRQDLFFPQIPQVPQPRKAPETVEELIEQVRQDVVSQMSQQFQTYEQRQQAMAMRAAGEQRARGILSEQNLGAKELAYDEVIGKYVAPLAQQAPHVDQLLNMQKDPSTARYFFGLMLKMADKYQGDPVKVARAIHNALNTEARAEQQVVQKISQAVKGSSKVSGATGKGSFKAARAPKSINEMAAGDVWAMSDEEFKALDSSIRQKTGI